MIKLERHRRFKIEASDRYDGIYMTFKVTPRKLTGNIIQYVFQRIKKLL